MSVFNSSRFNTNGTVTLGYLQTNYPTKQDVTSDLAGYLPLAGGTISGNIVVDGGTTLADAEIKGTLVCDNDINAVSSAITTMYGTPNLSIEPSGAGVSIGSSSMPTPLWAGLSSFAIGTFTPLIGNVTAVYFTNAGDQTGTYMQFGSVVFINAYVSWSNKGSTLTTDTIGISGLPSTPISGTQALSVCSPNGISTALVGGAIVGSATGSPPLSYLIIKDTTGAAITGTHFATSGYIFITGFYTNA